MKLQEALIAMINGENITRRSYPKDAIVFFDREKKQFTYSDFIGFSPAKECLAHKDGYVIHERGFEVNIDGNKISVSGNIKEKLEEYLENQLAIEKALKADEEE